MYQVSNSVDGGEWNEIINYLSWCGLTNLAKGEEHYYIRFHSSTVCLSLWCFFCGARTVRVCAFQAERMELMCKCQRQEQQVADLRKLVDEIAKLEQGAPDMSGDANWETQSVCSDLSGVSRRDRSASFLFIYLGIVCVGVVCSCSC